jgi:hypothetical protein
MTDKRKAPTKRQIENFIMEVPRHFNMMHNEMIKHASYEITEQEVVDAFAAEGDKDFILNRSKLLYGSMRREYYAPDPKVWITIPDQPYDVSIVMSGVTGFVVPDYFKGKKPISALPPSMAETVRNYVAEAGPLVSMWKDATQAYEMLKLKCDNNLPLMLAMWPALASVASKVDFDIHACPKARTVRAATPGLREQLQRATTFVNTAMLMGETAGVERAIRIEIA